jgi:3-oxoacyl-[acyl-carrier protein] reductase
MQNVSDNHTGKIVLLTGASGGIGRVLTQQLLDVGYTVVAQVRQHPEVLDNIISDNLHVVSANLADYDERTRMFQDISGLAGPPHILINNAGINVNGMSWKLSWSDWRKILDINLDAAFHLSQLCLPAMREKNWGRIVYISSVVASQGVAGTAPYAASKAALLGLMRAQAAEVAAKNITVNAIAPGYLNAGMIEQVPEPMLSKLKASIPAGTLGSVAEMGSMLQWVIGEESSYFTGQTLHFNGGLFS